MMKTLLWLDDYRNPLEDNWLAFSPIEQPYEVHWVKSYAEFTAWIETNGLPTAICFDHDLADEHYTPQEYWSDYKKSKAYQESLDYKEKTGKDCANFLVEYCLDKDLPLPAWNIQSANPVGADNIRGMLSSYTGYSEHCRMMKESTKSV